MSGSCVLYGSKFEYSKCFAGWYIPYLVYFQHWPYTLTGIHTAVPGSLLLAVFQGILLCEVLRVQYYSESILLGHAAVFPGSILGLSIPLSARSISPSAVLLTYSKYSQYSTAVAPRHKKRAPRRCAARVGFRGGSIERNVGPEARFDPQRGSRRRLNVGEKADGLRSFLDDGQTPLHDTVQLRCARRGEFLPDATILTVL